MPKYHVARSIEIDASPEDVFNLVSDFGTWTKWSPWLCSEPDAEVIVSDDAKSVGSQYSWAGEVVGHGEIEHKELVPGQLVVEEIRFLKPWKSVSKVTFELEPAGDGTNLTWHMYGALPWFMFWMKSLMETFIGMDYERGLKMIKELIETGDILAKTMIRGVESVGPIRMAGIRTTCAIEDIGSSMETVFQQVKHIFETNGLSMEQPISVYHKCDFKRRTFDYSGGFVLPENAEVPTGLTTWSIPNVRALCVEQIGRYEHLGNAWSAAYGYARYKKMKPSKVGSFEFYKNDPADTEPADLRTEVYLPLK